MQVRPSKSRLEGLTEKEVDAVQIGLGEPEFGTQSLSGRAEFVSAGCTINNWRETSGRNREQRPE